MNDGKGNNTENSLMDERSIAFIDTEVEPERGKVLDVGCIKGDGSTFHNSSLGEFIKFLNGTRFVCGHNILNHDLKYIEKELNDEVINPANVIDTLFLSPLLFPTKPYHSLVKDDKLQSDELNNPLNDSIKARDLFNDEVTAFQQTDELLKQIFYLLLNDKKEFQAFFRYIAYASVRADLENLVREKFKNEICENVDLSKIVTEQPIPLAYCLSLINSIVRHKKTFSIPPRWVLKEYPAVETILSILRNKPCARGCAYCSNALDTHKALKRYFGFDSFRTYGGEPLQEKAAKAAVDNKSLLAVFPTGGGKSITFQVPALMSGENTNGLTVVISPLQSLMKDQVDNLEKIGITDAVTVNGLLDPIERAKSLERVEDGSASLLYISPESLRSNTMERLILGRKIVRFVIDEAHCLSSWGHDFRVDYLYIADFIRAIQNKKSLADGIPVSCFTATAKQNVIEDIRNYFKEKLSIDLELFTSKSTRKNLRYKVFEKGNEKDKYQAARDLILQKNCPTIIYVSRTKAAEKLAEHLRNDGFNATPYYGTMDVREKTVNQNAFMDGNVPIMVATSAFGMGVDKKDVGMVIHYEISDSLENYIQESGRAGRNDNITAECIVLFNEEDLGKHFVLLNQTKLSIKEIQQIWKAIKGVTKSPLTVAVSALEIARKAGWNDTRKEIETRVKTAIAALENAGYLRRGKNMPRVFANSILSRNAQIAIAKINDSRMFDEKQKEYAIRIIKKLISNKNTKQPNEETAESRVDYISDILGIPIVDVIGVIALLREEGILGDTKDLTAFIKKEERINRSLNIVETFSKIERFLFSIIEEQEKSFHIKDLNEKAEENGCKDVSVDKIKTILNIWAIKNWIKRKKIEYSMNHVVMLFVNRKDILKEKLEKRHELAKFIVEYLYEKHNSHTSVETSPEGDVLVEFSVHDLKNAYEKSATLFRYPISIDDIEDALFYLSRIEAIKIEGGFLVLYNRLNIERVEQDNKKKYTNDQYKKLRQFYENRAQQIHIVGEYARKMISDHKLAPQFVEDYFQLGYSIFRNKYFPGSRADELKLKMTTAKYKQLFGELSQTQLKIIKDNESNYIAVAAGPGSGKTKLLVHKLASLLLMEDVKHEQLLMLTFSRAAATEFKKRLIALIGNAAKYVEIKTFHSYCFDLLGKVGTLNKSDGIIRETIDKISNKDVELSRITKAVLVIDEAQDMDQDEYNLINTLMEQNEEMRVIAVGDDDQNIYKFRGSSSKYLEHFIKINKATKYELIENYRSKSNLVEFTNQFVKRIQHRMKNTPIAAKQAGTGIIKLIRYRNGNLIEPLVRGIPGKLQGTTCVLTNTNDAASQIAGLLLNRNRKAKLIQTNDGFNLYNLSEVRYFLDQLHAGKISDDVWADAKRKLNNEFRNSTKLEICNNIVKEFEDTVQKIKYKSDLEIFIRESKLEDFCNELGDTIFVSTIHKAKGREFDNVFLMLENFNADTDEAKRQLYVAMTRAKQNLTIHINTNILDNISVENMQYSEDTATYPEPHEITMHLTHKDVALGDFEYAQESISQLVSGDTLRVVGNLCYNIDKQKIIKFSRNFISEIERLKKRNYELKSGKVNFILFWYKKKTKKDLKIILPELLFEKNTEEK